MSTFSISFPKIGVSFVTSISKPSGSCILLYASLGKVRHNAVVLFQGNRCSVCYGITSSRNLVAGLVVGSMTIILCRHFSILVCIINTFGNYGSALHHVCTRARMSDVQKWVGLVS